MFDSPGPLQRRLRGVFMDRADRADQRARALDRELAKARALGLGGSGVGSGGNASDLPNTSLHAGAEAGTGEGDVSQLALLRGMEVRAGPDRELGRQSAAPAPASASSGLESFGLETDMDTRGAGLAVAQQSLALRQTRARVDEMIASSKAGIAAHTLKQHAVASAAAAQQASADQRGSSSAAVAAAATRAKPITDDVAGLAAAALNE